MEWTGGKPGSEMPMSGDHLKMAFGAHDEARSREILEETLESLGTYDPQAYMALRVVFDADTGAYNDYEYFTKHPGNKEIVDRGVALIAAKLRDTNLYVMPLRPYTRREQDRRDSRDGSVYKMWCEGKESGRHRLDVIAEIRDMYGISERTVYQIVERQTPEEKKLEKSRKK